MLSKGKAAKVQFAVQALEPVADIAEGRRGMSPALQGP